MKVLRKTVGWVSVLIGAVLFGWQVHLDDAYAAKMPRSEDREGGRVVPLVVHHGSHIFVTPAEAETFAAAGRRLTFGWPLVALGMAVAAADHLWERRNRAKNSRANASAG
jgi:hypothetical protein